MPVSHGYDESFNQSLQNALFNLSKTGQTDFILSTQLRENQRLVGLPFWLLVFLFCLKDIYILYLCYTYILLKKPRIYLVYSFYICWTNIYFYFRQCQVEFKKLHMKLTLDSHDVAIVDLKVFTFYMILAKLQWHP